MTAPRTRLEQLASAAHLSVREFCAEYHRAGTTIGEVAHLSETQAKRWLGGAGGLPRAVACRVLEAWWAEPVTTLLGPPTGRGPAIVAVDTR